ncbi:hypothetical protein CDAR_560421 [Caerostris darwini]|uniref:Uncharacterized protein n=1 Tax=Caerostris darwini TaxID=1538125 RepID=A0AAV4VZQ6_9ARAC|nr:hypothetical protein CDAR_560161 [Caerostris darwini]GIY75682.1 hypothetical protein CDAR_560421 [Caerostris darwini]
MYFLFDPSALPTGKLFFKLYKMFSYAKIIAIAVLCFAFLFFVVDLTSAMPHHHNQGGYGGLAELLAAGLIAKLFQHHHG